MKCANCQIYDRSQSVVYNSGYCSLKKSYVWGDTFCMCLNFIPRLHDECKIKEEVQYAGYGKSVGQRS